MTLQEIELKMLGKINVSIKASAVSDPLRVKVWGHEEAAKACAEVALSLLEKEREKMKNERYYLIGWEFNNIWKNASLLLKDDEYLMEADDFDKAPTFTREEAEKKREYLQRQYPDIVWYIMPTNESHPSTDNR